MNIYKEYGDPDSPLMLFLHGGGVGGWMWDQQVSYFSNYRCIVPELLHHEVNDFSIETTANQVLEFIDTYANGRPVTVIGFSLGAQILVHMLSTHPKSVDYAIINSALVRGVPLSTTLLKTMKLAMPLTKLRSFAKLQAKTLYINDQYFERYYQESSQMTWEIFSKVMQENMKFKIPEHFREAQGNILVTVGSKEKKIMKQSMMDLVNANINCRGCILPNIGHGAPIAIPELFNKMVDLWTAEGRLPDSLKVF